MPRTVCSSPKGKCRLDSSMCAQQVCTGKRQRAEQGKKALPPTSFHLTGRMLVQSEGHTWGRGTCVYGALGHITLQRGHLGNTLLR